MTNDRSVQGGSVRQLQPGGVYYYEARTPDAVTRGRFVILE